MSYPLRFAAACFVIAALAYAYAVGFYFYVSKVDGNVTVDVVDKYQWRDEWGNTHSILKVDISGAADYTQVSVSEKTWERSAIGQPETFRRAINPWRLSEDSTFEPLTPNIDYSWWFIRTRYIMLYAWEYIWLCIFGGVCALVVAGFNTMYDVRDTNYYDVARRIRPTTKHK